jgi:hypothetical protein
MSSTTSSPMDTNFLDGHPGLADTCTLVQVRPVQLISIRSRFILSLDTGKITAQYHVVFDDWFNTVSSTDESQINFEHDNWYRTFGLTEYQYVVEEDTPTDLPDPNQREMAERREHFHRIRDANTPLPTPTQSVRVFPTLPPGDRVQRDRDHQDHVHHNPIPPTSPNFEKPLPVSPLSIPSPIVKTPLAPP